MTVGEIGLTLKLKSTVMKPTTTILSTRGTFIQINSVTLDSYGNLELVRWSFNAKPGTQKDIQKNILQLDGDLFK